MSNGKHEKKDVNVSLMKPSHEMGVNTCYQVTDCSDVSFILFHIVSKNSEKSRGYLPNLPLIIFTTMILEGKKPVGQMGQFAGS